MGELAVNNNRYNRNPDNPLNNRRLLAFSGRSRLGDGNLAGLCHALETSGEEFPVQLFMKARTFLNIFSPRSVDSDVKQEIRSRNKFTSWNQRFWVDV